MCGWIYHHWIDVSWKQYIIISICTLGLPSFCGWSYQYVLYFWPHRRWFETYFNFILRVIQAFTTWAICSLTVWINCLWCTYIYIYILYFEKHMMYKIYVSLSIYYIYIYIISDIFLHKLLYINNINIYIIINIIYLILIIFIYI